MEFQVLFIQLYVDVTVGMSSVRVCLVEFIWSRIIWRGQSCQFLLEHIRFECLK